MDEVSIRISFEIVHTDPLRCIRPTDYIFNMSSPKMVKAAAIHAAPVFLHATETTSKALAQISAAAANGADLIVFAEAFIPGFPLFAATGAPVDNEGCFARYVESSVYADGPEIAAVREKARECRVVVSLGFSERSRNSVGCLWNSNVLIGDKGQVLAHHRVSRIFFERKSVNYSSLDDASCHNAQSSLNTKAQRRTAKHQKLTADHT